MEWMNYHHLLYFWMVVREGTVARASQQLRLAQPTISGQIRVLEDVLGEKLFARSGRTLVLTDVGRMVYRYADEIFSLGRELQEVLKGRPPGRPIKLVVGVSDVVPKFIAFRLIQPAFGLPEPVQLLCQEDRPDRLVAELSQHNLDLVVSDAPLDPNTRVRAFNHLLGSCGVSIFGSPDLAKKYKRNFPKSLDGAPFLLPVPQANLRRSLDQWFDASGIRPQVVGEFQDTALLKVFGQEGMGVFAAPSVIEKEIGAHYGVKLIGRIPELIERFYAISVERRLKHPAVVAISEAARNVLFAPEA